MNIELTTIENDPRFMDKLTAYFSDINLSIRAKILLSSLMVIFLMVAVNSIMILNVLQFNRNYDAIITNITTANSINGFISLLSTPKCGILWRAKLNSVLGISMLSSIRSMIKLL